MKVPSVLAGAAGGGVVAAALVPLPAVTAGVVLVVVEPEVLVVAVVEAGAGGTTGVLATAADGSVAADARAVASPALSQVARPPKREKPIPFKICPSNPTALAGTCRRTHWPAAGKAPMYWRLAVPSVP